MKLPTFLLVLACALAATLAVPALAADWPTYRHDAQRSGVSAETLPAPLSEAWVFTPAFPPSKAWGDPQPKPVERVLELPRMRFDDAFHVAAAGDLVYFGSSPECKVSALDAKSGAVRWEFHAEGPVRLAPTVAAGKVYFGSDDGRVYCLDAADGRLAWSFSAAPTPQRLLGNGRIISVWPVRTGVVVDGGAAYFGAGVFPAEGLYLYAVAADTGKLIWKNDSYDRGGAAGISPQGYMVMSKDKVFVPSGRAMPAAFSRTDGRLLFNRNFSWRDVGLFGGTNVSLAGGLLLTAAEQLIAVSEDTGALVFAEYLPADTPSEGARQVVMSNDTIYLATGKEVLAFDRAAWTARRKHFTDLKVEIATVTKQRDELQAQARTNKDLLPQVQELQARLAKAAAERKDLASRMDEGAKWRTACPATDSLILAGGTLLAGSADSVAAFDAATGRKTWSAPVSGRARGLAVANGRLLVSTDKGGIHCFVAGAAGAGRKVSPAAADPFPKDDRTALYAQTAESIIKDSGATRGYALIIGGTGRLAVELAKRTDLVIYVAEPDAKKAAAESQALASAGVGGKVTVIRPQTPGELPLPDYFANLIVDENALLSDAAPALPAAEVLRMLKPCGGAAFLGRPPGDAKAAAPPALQGWLVDFQKALDDLGEKSTRITAGPWARITRGPLNGAGSWTHEYAEPGNSACSDDQLVRGPIGILWFGDPGPDRMPSRHSSNSSPLAFGGRMFIEGENVIMAYDAYNGLLLWQQEIPGALRTGLKTNCSNLAADDNSVFVTVGDRCIRLDAATGKTLNTYKTPATDDPDAKRRWMYVATAGGLLYGCTDGNRLFALDIKTGGQKWVYDAKTIMPVTISIGDGRVFFVDRTVTPEEEKEALKSLPPGPRTDARGKAITPDVRAVVALDAATGRQHWRRPMDFSDCVKIGVSGGELTAMYSRGTLVLCAQPWNGHFWKEFMAGEFSRRGIIALTGSDGRTAWAGNKGYRSRPLIVGDRVIAEPWSYDLSTGADTQRPNPITGDVARWQMSRPGHHCGNIAAAPNALFFRSGVTAFYDLVGDYGTAHFGAQRPGCWINCIPANGVVVMPEASSGCVCSYAIQCTIVFHQVKANRVWGTFSAPGAVTPVKHLAVAFGAPGDRKDSAGTLWLGYPRPPGPGSERLVLDLKLDADVAKSGGYFYKNADSFRVEGTRDPWLFASGCRGLARCALPLGAKGPYTVHLLFAAVDGEKAGQRVFDVKLQGRAVLAGFDVATESGGALKAVVKEFKAVQGGENLILELVPKGPTPSPASLPIISGIEVIAEASQ